MISAVLTGLSSLQRYAAIGLAIALGVSLLANGALTKAWLGARDDVAAAKAECNADKLKIVADAEKIARNAEREAADRRVAAVQAELRR